MAAAIMAGGVFLLSGVVGGLPLMSNRPHDETPPVRSPSATDSPGRLPGPHRLPHRPRHSGVQGPQVGLDQHHGHGERAVHPLLRQPRRRRPALVRGRRLTTGSWQAATRDATAGAVALAALANPAPRPVLPTGLLPNRAGNEPRRTYEFRSYRPPGHAPTDRRYVTWGDGLPCPVSLSWKTSRCAALAARPDHRNRVIATGSSRRCGRGPLPATRRPGRRRSRGRPRWCAPRWGRRAGSPHPRGRWER